MRTWECGYRTIFLCEYHLLTGDREVLPAIEALTLALARGQGMYGTFGHGFSEPAADGGLHGPIPPYGPVNAAGLIGNLAIVMGRTCGVADPEVAAAIDRGSRFFGYYVGKGAIPYGEHMPWPHHDNNGKNAMAAAFFALQGDRPEESRFFTKMVTASFRNREYGHTGQGFSYLWGGPGAGMGGPAAAAAFFKEASWHLDLVRRCDGSFTYDGSEQYGPGSTDDDSYFGKSGYYGLSPTASYVLTYALPLRAICLTGREADESQWLDDGDVAEAVMSGRFDTDRATMATADLVAALGDWSPVARGWAAEEVARRPEGNQLVPQLIALAEGPNPRVRQGACEALGRLRAPEALPVLVRLLVHEDRWLRTKAAQALEGMGDAARPVVPDMLAVVASTAEPLEPIIWADPIQLTHGELAAALFKGLLRSSIDDVDRVLPCRERRGRIPGRSAQRQTRWCGEGGDRGDRVGHRVSAAPHADRRGAGLPGHGPPARAVGRGARKRNAVRRTAVGRWTRRAVGRWTRCLVAVRLTPHGVGKDPGSVLASPHASRRWEGSGLCLGLTPRLTALGLDDGYAQPAHADLRRRIHQLQAAAAAIHVRPVGSGTAAIPPAWPAGGL
jgi:hypothetical protein